jgi:hypothetical protein
VAGTTALFFSNCNATNHERHFRCSTGAPDVAARHGVGMGLACFGGLASPCGGGRLTRVGAPSRRCPEQAHQHQHEAVR